MAELEMRIRALTTAIYLIQPKLRPSGIQYPYRTLSKAYNHLSILLSLGSEGGVAITGNADRSAICAVIAQEIVPHRELTQNARSSSSGADFLKVHKIEPSILSLDDLADPSKNPPTQEVAIGVHGSDLFKALIDLSNNRSPENNSKFMRFVWLRCHRKMKHRLKADEVMLGMPLHKILQGWNLEDCDAVGETYFRVHQNLYELFDSFQIPFQVAEGTTKREYQLSSSTVPAWCSLFARAFAGVKEQAETCDMEPGMIDDLNEQFFTLESLLHHNKAFETILSLPSLKARVWVAMLSTEEVRRNVESIPLPDDDFYATPFDEDFEPSRTYPALRCCMKMVAWHRAGLSLSRSKVFKDKPPHFYMVSAYQSANHSSMTDLRTLMMETILPNLKHYPHAAICIERLLQLDKFVRTKKFTGTTHCEATTMALIHSFTSTPLPKHFLPYDKISDLRLLFLEADRVIGNAKHACLCCYWLGGLLHSSNEPPFMLAGTHGVIFPWTPPLFGIPVQVLERLEEKLISKLTEVTTTWIALNE